MEVYRYSSNYSTICEFENLHTPKLRNVYVSRKAFLDFPGGTVDRNLLANAEDTGSIPGLGRFHVLQSS